jgi:hypothetical protein
LNDFLPRVLREGGIFKTVSASFCIAAFKSCRACG